MSQPEPQVLIIGAGPAGLSAAVAAGEAGARVLLVDEGAGPGGQYLSGQPNKGGFQTQAERDGSLLISRLTELCRVGQVAVWWGATVWNLNANLTAMISLDAAPGGARTERVQAGAIVLATGARETVVPFPGWTLPGVMTVGAAQLLAKRQNIVPLTDGKPGDGARPRVLLAGSGLLLLPAATKLAELGAHVVGVLETTRLGIGLLRKAGGAGNIANLVRPFWARRAETWHYFSALRKHGIPYLIGRAVVRAMASVDGRLAAADVVRLDANGQAVPGSVGTWSIDLLCAGNGLVPNVELAQLAGARLIYDAALGGWAVEVDAATGVQTSIAGLFVAGESAGIGGANAAMLGGRAAGLSAAAHVGRLPGATFRSELAHTSRQRQGEARFGAVTTLCFAPPDGLYRTIPDETPICRCEEVTAGQVHAAISAGARSLDALKPAVRTGQGLCQGRTCGPLLARMLAARAGTSPEAAGLFRARPPVKPVPLASIAGFSGSEEPEATPQVAAQAAAAPSAR
jgi:D-hydroxyproline dehydrogenase subunit alpha